MIAILLVIVLAVSAIGTLMVFAKSVNLLDCEFRVIVTGSMDGEPQEEYEIKTIPVNSLIAAHKMHSDMLDDIKVGDVIGFYSSMVGGNVYHRVIEIDTERGVFITHGDNTHATETVPFGDANGIVVNVNHPAGEFIMFVKQNVMYIAAAIILLLIMAEAFAYLIKVWRE